MSHEVQKKMTNLRKIFIVIMQKKNLKILKSLIENSARIIKGYSQES